MSSMAFTKSAQARHLLDPAHAGALTTLQTSPHAADRPVAPPRFDPGLSTGPGGFTTEDPGVSPERTHTGWPSRACVRYGMTAFAFMAPTNYWTHVDQGSHDTDDDWYFGGVNGVTAAVAERAQEGHFQEFLDVGVIDGGNCTSCWCTSSTSEELPNEDFRRIQRGLHAYAHRKS